MTSPINNANIQCPTVNPSVPNILRPWPAMLPPSVFSNLIDKAAISVLWYKSHGCPCVGSIGAAVQDCPTCLGRGIYWDSALGPYKVLITLITITGRNINSVGVETSPDFGATFEGSPILTIGQDQTPIWQEASPYDAFVEIDSTTRFNGLLQVGGVTTIPFWHTLSSLTIAPSGAVVVEDSSVIPPRPVANVPYTVNGGTVTLNGSTYPKGTWYTVEYVSSLVFILYDRFGGLPHTRPFDSLMYPRRFKIDILDRWLRNQMGVNGVVALNTNGIPTGTGY